MINSHNIQADLTHEGEIDIHLLRPPEIVPLGVRLERTVRDAFDEKLFVAFEKEFRRRANSRVCVVVMSSEVETSINVECDSIKRFLDCARNDKREPLARSKILSAFLWKTRVVS